MLLTAFWQIAAARYMPPLVTARCPASLLERLAGNAAEQLLRPLVFLTPVTVMSIALGEGC